VALQVIQFLAAAAENERITALQPDNPKARPRLFHQEIIDFRLAAGVAALGLADIDAIGIAPAGVNDRWADSRS
jgi:hypothetical protein